MLEITSSFISDFKTLCSLYNETGNEFNTSVEFIKTWLNKRQLVFNYSKNIGIYLSFNILHPSNINIYGGFLLIAHLDSVGLSESNINIEYNEETQNFIWDTDNGEIGLDDKTGIIVILSLIDKLLLENKINQEKNHNNKYKELHIYFPVGEEVGQKGSVNYPINNIFGKVGYALSIDRITSRHKNSNRHIVDTYHDIPLLYNKQHPSLMQLLNNSCNILLKEYTKDLLDKTTMKSGIKSCKSPFSSDICEIRAHFDIQILYCIVHNIHKDKIKLNDDSLMDIARNLLTNYNNLTNELKTIYNEAEWNNRILCFNSYPRGDRYTILYTINEFIKNNTILSQEYQLSAGNLSLDYNESRGNISVFELNETRDIIYSMLFS